MTNVTLEDLQLINVTLTEKLNNFFTNNPVDLEKLYKACFDQDSEGHFDSLMDVVDWNETDETYEYWEDLFWREKKFGAFRRRGKMDVWSWANYTK